MKRKHYFPYAEHIYLSLFIIKVLNFLSSVTQFIHSIFLNNFISVYHPIYFILLLHMYSFLLCKNTNQPSFKWLIGLSTRWQMFYTAWYKFLLPHLHALLTWSLRYYTDSLLDLYLYCRIMTYVIYCQIVLNVTFLLICWVWD